MADVLAAIEALPDPILKAKAQRAVASIARTLDIFSPPAVAFSFNGGKDSTVILHLLRAAVAGRGDGDDGTTTSLSASGVRTFILDRPPADDFPEVRAFVAEADATFGLGLDRLRLDSGQPMAAVLGSYLSTHGTQAILLGTRRGDPNAAGQAEWCPSSPGWPAFMRVNPVIEWGYGDVWGFLDGVEAPYCPLYDAGFTSLGSVTATAPNAALARGDGSYAPARELSDGREERAGRRGGGAVANGGGPARPASAPTRTAAVLIVGDELLTARVPEGNAGFLCARLHAAGWRVGRVVVLPDEMSAIATEVAASSAAHTAVIVAGGVGPTDDDVTMAGVAGAFGVALVRDPDLEARLRAYFEETAKAGEGTINESHLKMADAPEGVEAVEVTTGGGEGPAAADADANAAAAAASPPRPSPFPLLAFRNCFILPGVPTLLRRKWPALEATLAARFGACAPFTAVSLRLSLGDEGAAGPALAAAAKAAGGRARVGSYPLDPPSPEDGARLVVVVEGKDAGAVAAGVAAAVGALPVGCVIREDASGVVV